MVANKRPRDGGFHDLLKSVIPKAPRSLRRRISRDKSSEDGEVCGFELLADAADKLLQEQESESSTSSTDPKEKGQISIPEEVKNDLHEVKVKPTNRDPLLNGTPHSENDSGSDHASIVTNTDFKTKVNSSLIMEAIEDKSGNICNVDFGKAVDKSVGLTSVRTLNDRLEPCVNTRVPNKSSSSVHLSFCKDTTHRGNVNINIRDDDEKYSRYNKINHRNTRLSAFGSQSRAGYKRVRKMGPSRYWKVARKFKDYENSSGRVISFYHKRKRFQADAVCKRKKLFHQRQRNSCIKKVCNERVSNLVKFSIKSFKVPDLYVEVPETATVGLLKRSVMEAVTAILHGQLHVGVLVEGNRVRDDNRTLQQSGISQNCNLESLGFMLEPSLSEGSSFLVQQETASCPMRPQISRDPSISDMENRAEKNEVCTTFEAEGTTKEDSKAFVLAPAAKDAEALAVVPLSETPTKRYEFSQRRIRRPFSVSEVEALVEAVETLGAGRWRDVKMRAFGDADHRTYVDLKDKWKTLVHTASIAPQQRRGEAVPQDLLDRVLAAHAYWSQHQHVKKHQKTPEVQL